MAGLSTSDDSIQIKENKIIAADENISLKNVLNNDKTTILDNDPKKVCKTDNENRQIKI